jgi:hypothetical protein
LSGVFENQRSAVVQLDFLGLPCRALVESFWVGIRWVSGTVEPVEIRFVVGGEESVGGEDVEVGVEDQVIISNMDRYSKNPLVRCNRF